VFYSTLTHYKTPSNTLKHPQIGPKSISKSKIFQNQKKKVKKIPKSKKSKVKNIFLHQIYFPNQAITSDQMGGVEKGDHRTQRNGLDGKGGGFKVK
jgi:hypothetical protein